jgi:iron complex transport system ATP-binding protein
MNRPSQPSAVPETGLSCDRITVRYRKGQPAILDGQSVTIPGGHITAFIGPNGSGKSTLLKTLARQLAPESGTVILDGKDIATLPVRQVARRLGVLFQENSAPNDLTVKDLAYHGRYPHRRLFESLSQEDEEAVEQALIQAGAIALRNRPVSQLSSGQKQLAWIAMLLAQSPQYLFLDEPTTFLDLAHQFDVMELILRLNREWGKTIVLVVHDLNHAARYADHVLALRDGHIVSSGTPADVLTTATLREVFDVETQIIRNDANGKLYCIPTGRHG